MNKIWVRNLNATFRNFSQPVISYKIPQNPSMFWPQYDNDHQNHILHILNYISPNIQNKTVYFLISLLSLANLHKWLNFKFTPESSWIPKHSRSYPTEIKRTTASYETRPSRSQPLHPTRHVLLARNHCILRDTSFPHAVRHPTHPARPMRNH